MPRAGPARTKHSTATKPEAPGPASPARGAAATEHLDEVATILALGIQRLRARQDTMESSTPDSTEETVRLDFTGQGSGHAPPRRREVSER